MGAWVCWRLHFGPHIALAIGGWVSAPAGATAGGLSVALLVGGRPICSADVAVRR
ncbi:hypothetical protein [Dactylosporangium sp. CA-233914]|uniref:hypothetical protein n=1 Tax=Dactylosporangium sp. CA-233914 TaxID=3239934 RepID=UPI003D902BEE